MANTLKIKIDVCFDETNKFDVFEGKHLQNNDNSAQENEGADIPSPLASYSI